MLVRVFVLLLLVTTTVFAQDRSGDVAGLEEQAFKQAAALVAPSLVRIETVGGLDRVGQVLVGTGPTTGIVVSREGYIISSSFNFIAKPASILVSLPDGRRLPAEQVANDKVKMLTLLKVAADNLIPAQAAPVESFRVGQWSIALGRTFDDPTGSPSISVGAVSALNRVWGKAIQTDAKVSPVNYGGPLVDIEGRVLGVLVPLSPQAQGEIAGVEWYDGGIGFAIPLAEVYASLERLKEGKDLFPGLMGITLKGRDMYADKPVIDRVRYGSPAQQAGFKEGDEIVELDGKKVERQTQILHVMGSKYAGDKVTLRAKRGEESVSHELTLTDKLVPYESAFLGILPEREATGVAAPKGVGVRFVVPGSPAELAKLQRGDRVLKFGDADLADAAALLDLVSRRRPGEAAKLTVQNGNARREVDVTLGSLPDAVPGELRAAAIVPRDNSNLPEDAPKVGRFTDKMPAHEHDYWAYVPQDYNPAFRYALVVWLHPGGDTLEATLTKSWQSLCDERGIILLAPKAKQIAGWSPDEAEFVKDTVDLFLEKYSIDRARVILHSYSTAGGFAYHVAFRNRQTFRGLCVVAAPLTQMPPDNEPDFRTQFYLLSGDADPAHRGVVATTEALRRMKYPVVHTIIPGGGHAYAASEQVHEIARWIDALDRI